MYPHMSSHSSSLQIEIAHLTLRYRRASNPVIEGLNLTFPAEQWTSLLGKSGCGKTTLLRHLASLTDQELISSGQIQLTKSINTTTQTQTQTQTQNETSMNSSLKGKIAYMAQQDLLLPWLSIIDNLCLSEKFDQQRPVDRGQALHLLHEIGLYQQRNARPETLSGGMRQRVALARTLMQEKPIVLMDEPFSALDAVTRHQLQNLAHQLLKGKTVILITHDPFEALRLGDSIYVLNGEPAKAEAIAVPPIPTPRRLDQLDGHAIEQIMQLLGSHDD
jgi:putative hydroxymethylpyrimidine transport system ATP-binding protein